MDGENESTAGTGPAVLAVAGERWRSRIGMGFLRAGAEGRLGAWKRWGRWGGVLEHGAVAMLGVVLFWVVAIRAGQDASWDLRNYHLYNGWAFVEGRMGWDIQPAMRQTYFNPLLDTPLYLLVEHVPALGVSLALAAFQSLLLVLVYALANAAMGSAGLRGFVRRGWAFAFAVLGVLAPMSVAQVGGSSGDNTVAVPALAGLVCAVAALRPGAVRHRGLLLGVGSLLLGAAVGLKPTMGPFALGLAAAVWAAPSSPREMAGRTAVCACGGLLGAALTGGFWWWRMYEAFGNPLFPQLNGVFGSPYAEPLSYADGNYRGEGWLGVALYPLLYNAVTGMDINTQRFGDLRLGALLVLSIAAAWRRVRGMAPIGDDAERAVRRSLLAFGGVSYLSWLVVFSIGRYMLLLEVIAPVLAWCLLRAGGAPRRWATAGVAAGGVLVVATAGTHDLGWASRHGGFVEARLPEAPLDGALIVMAGHSPTAYLAPSFPDSARFVRISGNLYYPNEDPSLEARYATALGDEIRRAIAGHRGPVYVMCLREEFEEASREAAHFGLGMDAGRSLEITSKIGPPVRLYPCSSSALHPSPGRTHDDR